MINFISTYTKNLITKNTLCSLLFLAAFLFSGRVVGQISLSALNTAYTQDFNGTNMSASSCPCNTVPPNWSLLETGSNADGNYAANSGTSTTGDTYNFYSGSGTEFSIGGLASNNLQTRFGARFTNNTGSTINELEISYKGEFWRYGQNATDQIDFAYSLNATTLVNGTWVEVDNLDFNDVGLAVGCRSGTAGARNGNATCNKSISFTISGLNITNGSSFFIRWVDLNISGTDNGLSVDDFSLTAKATASCTAPTVSTSLPTLITNNGVTLNADPLTFGTSATALNERGFQYSTNSGLSSPTSINQNVGNYNLDDYGIATGSVLAGNTRYYYRAYVINNCSTPLTGNSHTSSYPSFVTLPNALTANAAANIDDNGFDGSWGAATGSETVTYQVQVSSDNFASTVINQTGINVTSFTTNSLASSTNYKYRVRATNSQGSGAWSNEVSFTTAAAQSEINLVGNSQNIADGDLTPITTDHTDFGSVNVGSNLVRAFTIQNVNTATANLLLSGNPVVAISGSSDFAVTLQPSSTNIAPNSSVTFQVTFTPTGTGAKTADITINNNDGDENPYNFGIGGEAVPACVVPNAVTSITLTPSGLSVAGTIDAPIGGATGYLVVRNATGTLGTTPTNATSYTVGNAFGTGTVVAFGTSNTFNASGLNTNTTYHFFVFPYNNTSCFGGPTYNTSGYTENTTTLNLPYQAFDNFDRTNSNTVGIPSSGGSTAWTEVESGSTSARISSNALILERNGNGGSNGQEYVSFDMSGKYPTIFNTASSNLEWYFNVHQTRTDPSGFNTISSNVYGTAYILGSTSNNVDAGNGYAVIVGNQNGGSSPFGASEGIHLVSFTGGLINANISPIISFYTAINLTNEFSIGVKFNPSNNQWELLVRDDGTFGGGFVDPTDVNVSHSRGTAINSTYVGSNLQHGILYWKRGSAVDNAMFDNVSIPLASSNVPEIKVEYTTNNAVEINDAGSYNFGPVAEAGNTSYTATFTITNVGTANLTLGTLGVSGSNASEFTVTQPSITSLAANSTTTFTVAFNPSATGNRTTTLSFSNNDADENPFNFTLNGEGTNTAPLINEFVADHTGTDNYEYVEVFGESNKNYSNLSVVLIEGDGINMPGVVEKIYTLGTTNANGYWFNTIAGTNEIENNTVTYLLVEGFTGALNNDLDTDDDGTFDSKPWNRILDAVAYKENATTDKVYASVFFTSTFAGYNPPQNVGGASRIPNGTNTGNTNDWMRNEFTGFGILGFNTATPSSKEAINTPGEANTPYNIWTGNISSVWNDAGNWTVGVPTTVNNLDAVIPNVSNDPVFPIGGFNAFARYFVTEVDASLNMNAGDLTISADMYNGTNTTLTNADVTFTTPNSKIFGTATFDVLTLNLSGTGSVELQSTATLNINNKLELETGTLVVATGGNLTLKSSSSRTAYVDDFVDATGVTNAGTGITGNITLERYIPTNSHPLSYHYIGAINGANVGSPSLWGGDFSITATTAADGTNVTPTSTCDPTQLETGSAFGTLFSYNEADVTDCSQRGWEVRTTAAPTQKGQGFAARIPAFTVLNETGAYSNSTITRSGLSVTSSNSNIGNAADTRGNHLVANPFFAPIDWNIVRLNGLNINLDGTAYKFNGSGNAVPYNNLTGSNIFSTNEAFFIVPSDPNGSAITINFPATARRNSNNNELLRQQQPYAYALKVNVTADNNTSDNTLIAFDNTFTEQYDDAKDARKMMSDAGVPSIYTLDNSSERQCIMALPENTQSKSIPLSVNIQYNGNHAFTFDGINDFPATAFIYLEDKQSNTWHNLRINNTYSFTANMSDDADRFVLHFEPAMQITAQDAGCDNNNGSINLNQAGNTTWNYELTDANNNSVSSQNNFNGNQNISNLSGGVYTLTLNHSSGYTTNQTITINSATGITAQINATANTAQINEVISFEAISNGTQNNWDMGDGTTYTNQSQVSHSYSQAGNYTVSVSSSNAACSATVTYEVSVADITTSIANNVTGSIHVNAHNNALSIKQTLNKESQKATLNIYNALGQSVSNHSLQLAYNQVNSISLNELANGVYFAHINSNGKTQITKFVVSR